MDDRTADTLTFLFTGIVDPGRLSEGDPETRRRALSRHHELLRSAIEGEGGQLFTSPGDTWCAAFPDARGALRAAWQGQVSLAGESWPADRPIEVRMGVHSGAGTAHDGEYFGPVVNRVARVGATAHGGQIVVSAATQQVVEGALPPDLELRDLGPHRLKDLGRPEHLFELQGPGLAGGFPPLRSLENPDLPNNLPEQVTSFIGREEELAEISALVHGARLVTLVGTGGAGKTRLALQVAAELLDGTGDGVWFVELAALNDPDLVLSAVASALGLREEPRRPLFETVIDGIGTHRMLLVLDNCEHLIGAVANVAGQLLEACPGANLLATSRQPLGIGAERIYRVPSFSLPPEEPSEDSVRFDAVQFFVDRAQQHQPTFVVHDAIIPTMVEVCRRLDGIPLAIELAAVRLHSLSLNEIHRRLDDRFRLLTGGSRAALPRQQTLRAAVDWSYDLLSPREAMVLCHLSVFAGGFTLDAAEAIFSGDAFERFDVLAVLSSLADKSLLHGDSSDPNRFHLHETIRQYGGERLVEQGALARHAARDAHATVYLDLVERAAPHLVGREQRLWLERLEVERDNLRLAMGYFLGVASRHEQALRFGIALRRFWLARGYWAEGSELLTAALELPGSHAPRRLRATASCAAGQMCARRSRHADARLHYQESLQIARSLGDEALIAESLAGLAWAALSLGQHDAAGPLIDEAMVHARAAGNPQLLGLVLERRASVHYDDPDRCRADYAEALVYLRQVEDLFSIGIVENNMGDLELLTGNPAQARTHLENALAISLELQDRSVAYCYLNLGTAGVLSGDLHEARRSYLDAYRAARRAGDQFIIANCLLGFALCLAAEGRDEQAAEVHGVADGLLHQQGSVLEVGEAKLREEDHARLRQRMGQAVFEERYRVGRARPGPEGIEQAVAGAEAEAALAP